jgi:hypothetical protein
LPGRLAEVVAISALATVLTVAIAAPVLRAPAERVFGMEIVGRHHDPFTVMEQFGRPVSLDVYSQPVTDIAGALLARLAGPVAAYNWLVLLSFPMSAAAAYLLARHLSLSPAGATLAAIAYAFSPFHLAHAAYHPHIAQTQWLPLYLLALWRCLDNATPLAVGCLGAAAVAVTLSNFYGGLIAAVITPVAVVAYCVNAIPTPGRAIAARTDPRSMRRLWITAASLLVIAGSGIVYASYAASAVVTDRAAFAFPRADLFLYSAKWWSYLVPPVEHPLLGVHAAQLWSAVGVREGLLEQQVSLGWGIVGLGFIAVFRWVRRDSPPVSLTRVPILVIVAIAALLCSLSPERTISGFTVVRPSALLYLVAPMFRSYARFGVVVQLMAALLAGIGLEYLRRTGTRRAQIVCAALVALVAGEYAVAPPALSRDVLPTAAHRWVVQQVEPVRALDCTALNQESASAQWLTGGRTTLLGGSIADCAEPNLLPKLSALGYTHLLVRRDSADAQAYARHPAPDGLRAVARFADGQVFAVTARVPAILTGAMTGFFPREHHGARSWRWMGDDGAWAIVNTSAQPIVATLELEMSAFHRSRRLTLRLDGLPATDMQTLVVEPSRRIHQIGPLTIGPGTHELSFHPFEAATVADDAIHNGDRRALSFAIGTWNWAVRGDRP